MTFPHPNTTSTSPTHNMGLRPERKQGEVPGASRGLGEPQVRSLPHHNLLMPPERNRHTCHRSKNKPHQGKGPGPWGRKLRTSDPAHLVLSPCNPVLSTQEPSQRTRGVHGASGESGPVFNTAGSESHLQPNCDSFFSRRRFARRTEYPWKRRSDGMAYHDGRTTSKRQKKNSKTIPSVGAHIHAQAHGPLTLHPYVHRTVFKRRRGRRNPPSREN